MTILKNKLDKLVELNNTCESNEKQYETQIKQLQIKNNKLILLAERTISSDII